LGPETERADKLQRATQHLQQRLRQSGMAIVELIAVWTIAL
jgi:hypothetical protein